MADETERSSRGSPVSGMLRETLVVVVSILIAFSLDAWWYSAKDRMEEKSLMLYRA